MSTICFVLPPVYGPLGASLKLARELEARGHRIYYMGLTDSETAVRNNGFEFIALFEEWFSEGFFSAYDRLAELNKLEALKLGRSLYARLDAFLNALISGEDDSFFRIVDRIKPDLMIFMRSDDTVSIPALLAHKAGIKSVYMCSMLGRGADAFIPPVTTHLMAGRSLFDPIRTFLAWKKVHFGIRVLRRLYILAGLEVDWVKRIRKLAAECRYPWDMVETVIDVFAFDLKLPELVLFPREFDFPGAEKPGRYYIGGAMDTARSQPDFPMETLDGGRPLGYCALGTIAWLDRPGRRKFFETVIAACSAKPDWQWVIALGAGLTAEDFNTVPENVILVQRAPQLKILERARLMINHGGTNTVKECIYYGVPMIVFPEPNDTPGTTARVIYHGLGIKGNLRKLTANDLKAMIERVDTSSYYRIQVGLMREKFLAQEKSKTDLRVIEAILDMPGTGRECRGAEQAREDWIMDSGHGEICAS